MIVIPIQQPEYCLLRHKELYYQHNWQFLNRRIHKINQLSQY